MKLISFILFLCLSINSFSQIAKWRAKELTYGKFDISYRAEKPKTDSMNELITYDIDEERISIYGKNKLTYDITSYRAVINPADSVKGEYIFEAVNYNGKECKINLQLLKSGSWDAHLQIIYPDEFFWYDLKSLDN